MGLMFIKPSEGRLTNGFRTNARSDHNGVDFAQAGTVEIKAAAAGKITRSYTSTTYGEAIFILHHLNGQEYETVYAHMRTGSRRFSVGQTVKQGDVIGLMGSTGDSTGQHLHFELHKGRWNANKTNAVNPMDYISEAPTPTTPQPTFYVVVAGDTLTKIARSFNTTVNQLVAWNGIANPNLIKVGQRLRVK